MEGLEQIVVFVDYIGDNRVRSGQPFPPEEVSVMFFSEKSRSSKSCNKDVRGHVVFALSDSRYKITRTVWTCE